MLLVKTKVVRLRLKLNTSYYNTLLLLTYAASMELNETKQCLYGAIFQVNFCVLLTTLIENLHNYRVCMKEYVIKTF